MNKIYVAIPLGIAIILLIYPFAVYSGSQIMTVTSDSMVPTLKPNDIIIVKRVSIDTIKVGDIIAFDSHTEGVGIIAHRAIEIAEVNGKIGIDTQGDHLDHPDLWTVYDDTLIGVITEINPEGGIFLSQPVQYLLIAVIVGFGALLVMQSIPKKGLEVNKLICKRCNHSWFPRIIDGKVKIPETCPNKNCRSPYWQTQRRTD